MKDYRYFNLKIAAEDYELIRQIAFSERLTMSKIIRDAITLYIEKKVRPTTAWEEGLWNNNQKKQ